MVWKLMKGRLILPLLAAVVALILGATPAFAQTTGQLRVTVLDDLELEVPRVTLQLEGDTLIGGVLERETDNQGQHLFVELPPGSYRLTALKDGFIGVTIEGIKINISRTTQITVPMKPGNAETVVVDAPQKAVDVESTSRSQVLTKEFLDRIPAGRSYQTAVTMAAGVQGNGGNPNIAGGASNENTYMLDGVNITDPVTGTFSLNFNFDAIQQIEVLLGGYMPEYPTAVGGIVNVVTRTGTNNLEYNASIFYENGDLRPRMDERITADGFTIAPTGFDNTFTGYSVNALIAGPVIRDKAWFIISYTGRRTIIALSGVPQARDFDAQYVLARFTYQPTTEHRLSLLFQTNPTNIANQIQSTVFIKPESQRQQTQGGYVLSGKWQWFLNPDVSLETAATIQKIYIESSSVPCTHDKNRDWHQCEPGETEGYVDYETPGRIGNGGGAFDSVNDIRFYFDDRFRYNLSTELSLISVSDPWGGTHDLKFGAEGNQLVWDQMQGISGNQYYADINAVPFDPTSLENFLWLEASAPIDFRTTSSEFSLYAQDSWKPVSNLTVNWGARFDSFVQRNDLGEPVVAGALVGPRIFASWDPLKDQRTKIATGFGRFNDTGRLGIAQYTSASGFGSKLFPGETFSNYLGGQNELAAYNPRQNLNVAHDTLRTPRVDEIILLLEREIVPDVAVFSQMSGKFSRYLFEPDDRNLIWDSDGSAVIGSRFGDLQNLYGRLRTPALAQRDYYQWDLGVRKVLSNRWAAQATYTYANGVGSSNFSNSGAFLVDPRTQYNYGNLNVLARHQVKAQGFWDLPTDPWRQTIGFTFSAFSGFPLERLYYTEGINGNGGYGLRIRPRGTYFWFNPYWELGVQFSQRIDVRKGSIELQVQAENVTNNRAPDIPNFFVLAQQNRLLAVSRQDPLRLRFGAIYRF